MINALKDANITYPAGIIKEETYEYLVKTVGEFQNIDDISALSFSKRDVSHMAQPEDEGQANKK